MITSGCADIGLYKILVVVKKVLNIIMIVAPILLIIAVSFFIFTLVKDPDNSKKTVKKIINAAISLITIFLIPLLVNVVMFSLGSKTSFSSCWNEAVDNGNPSSYYEINDGRNSFLENSNEYEKGIKKNKDKNNKNKSKVDSSSIETSYGVYLGLDHSSGLDKLYSHKLVVIDLQEFTKDDVRKLHDKGIKVYSYLNIGSVEEYRDYYKKFDNNYLGVYENWEDERWVDVSNSSFQKFIINELEPSLREKGADGYFIDNCDVYANFKKDSIYNGLKKILGSIHKNGLTVLINGGDVFVSSTIKDGSYKDLFDGVNQEEVFTVINFDNHTYHKQSSSETKYYQNYLDKVKNNNLQVYLLEYGANSSLEKTIADYCSKNGFAYYNAKSYKLE